MIISIIGSIFVDKKTKDFSYNPLTGAIKSNIFLITKGSGFTAIAGGLLYWIASLTPLKKYMLRDREQLEII